MERGKGEDKKYIQERFISAECSHVYSVKRTPRARVDRLGHGPARDYIMLFHAFRSETTWGRTVSTPE